MRPTNLEADDFVTLVEDFFDAENERDWGRWAAFVHPHVSYEAVGMPRVVRGCDEYVRHMKEAYSTIPDWSFRVLHIFGDERAVISELDGAGHFTGTHRGKRIEEAPLRLRSICVFEFRAEQIYRVREYLGTPGEERQLDAASR